MSATIFVWKPHHQQVGHASMGLSDGTYISWWPTDDVHDSPAKSYSMRADKSEEGGIPSFASAPIEGLDEKKISDWWQSISGRRPDDYSPARHEVRDALGRFHLLTGANCSNMVVRGLLVGGLVTEYPLAAAIISKNVIMTPLTLIDVAQAITGDFGNKATAAARSISVGGAFLRTLVQYVVSP